MPFTLDPPLEVLSIDGAGEAIINTLLLTTGTTALMLVLLLPTIVFLNMKAPQLEQCLSPIASLGAAQNPRQNLRRSNRSR